MSRKIATFATADLIFVFFFWIRYSDPKYLIIPTLALGIALWKR